MQAIERERDKYREQAEKVTSAPDPEPLIPPVHPKKQ